MTMPPQVINVTCLDPRQLPIPINAFPRLEHEALFAVHDPLRPYFSQALRRPLEADFRTTGDERTLGDHRPPRYLADNALKEGAARSVRDIDVGCISEEEHVEEDQCEMKVFCDRRAV